MFFHTMAAQTINNSAGMVTSQKYKTLNRHIQEKERNPYSLKTVNRVLTTAA
jgi:hypothetical protein